MPGGQGLRARTRHMFARGFRQKGFIPLTTYLRNYKLGDYVDIIVNGAIHKVHIVFQKALGEIVAFGEVRRNSSRRREPNVGANAQNTPMRGNLCRACRTSGTRARLASSGTSPSVPSALRSTSG